MNAPAPGWLPDPDARHEYRYWDGSGWTDNVADGGVASTDPLGGIPAPAPTPAPWPGAEPTTQIDSTEQFPTSPVPPTSQYPGPGATGLGPDSGPGPGHYPQYPAPTPPRKRPSAGLIAGLAVLAIAGIGGSIWLLVSDDGGDSSDDDTEIGDKSDHPSNDTADDDTSDDDTSGDDTSGDDTSGDGLLPGDLDLEDEDAIVDMLATSIEQASDGQITHEQAVCVSQGVIDEFGTSGADPFNDSGMQDQLRDILDGCDIPPDLLDRQPIPRGESAPR
ncbi:MAG: DUF2510 domain-containing protein [Acidimicrobiales bacterium]